MAGSLEMMGQKILNSLQTLLINLLLRPMVSLDDNQIILVQIITQFAQKLIIKKIQFFNIIPGNILGLRGSVSSMNSLQSSINGALQKYNTFWLVNLSQLLLKLIFDFKKLFIRHKVVMMHSLDKNLELLLHGSFLDKNPVSVLVVLFFFEPFIHEKLLHWKTVRIYARLVKG